MVKARQRDLFGPQAAAGDGLALQQQHPVALQRQQRPGDQRVDPGADDDVIGPHLSPRGTSASARIGEPVPCLIFSGAAIRIAPLAGSLSRLASDGQTEAVVLVQQVVRRERRGHAARLARIGADALAAPADDALADQILDHLGGRPRRVRAGLVGVQEQVFVMRALVPVGPQDDPFARVDRAMLGFPGLHMVDGQQEIRVRPHIRR